MVRLVGGRGRSVGGPFLFPPPSGPLLGVTGRSSGPALINDGKKRGEEKRRRKKERRDREGGGQPSMEEWRT